MNDGEDSSDYLFPLAEAHAAAIFLNNVMNLQKWPSYYQHLMLCYNPWDYEVRFFQIQFCIVNKLDYIYYKLILKLNYWCGVGELDNRLEKKLRKLYEYVLRKSVSDPSSITSYNVANDGVTDCRNIDLFRRDEIGNYYESNGRVRPRYCNYRSMIDYMSNLGVYYLLHYLR